MPHPSNLGFVEKTLVGIDVANSNINEKVLAQAPIFETVPCPTVCLQGNADNEYADELYIHMDEAFFVITECLPPCLGEPVNPCPYCIVDPFQVNDASQDPTVTGGVIGMFQVGYFDVPPPAGRCYAGPPGSPNVSTTGCCWSFGSTDPDSPFAQPPTECNGVATGVPFGDLPGNNTGVLYQSGAFCAEFQTDSFGWLIIIMVAQCPDDVDTNLPGNPTCFEANVCGMNCNGIPPNLQCLCNDDIGSGEVVFFVVYVKPNVQTTNHPLGTPIGQYRRLFDDFPDPENRTCGGQFVNIPETLIVDTDPNPHPFIPP